MFVFFLSTYRFCNLNLLSLQAWTNHPAATAVRLAAKTCESGLFWESLLGLGSSSSSSSWRDQPAQTWCHGESSARVLHPKLTRQTSCEVGVTSSPGNRSLGTVSKSRCRDECVFVSPHLPTGLLPQNSFWVRNCASLEQKDKVLNTEQWLHLWVFYRKFLDLWTWLGFILILYCLIIVFIYIVVVPEPF